MGVLSLQMCRLQVLERAFSILHLIPTRLADKPDRSPIVEGQTNDDFTALLHGCHKARPVLAIDETDPLDLVQSGDAWFQISSADRIRREPPVHLRNQTGVAGLDGKTNPES